MARFNVQVRGDTPEQAKLASKALEQAGLFGSGPAESKRSTLAWQAHSLLFARLEADTADAAEAQVRDVVGDDCEVGPAQEVTSD